MLRLLEVTGARRIELVNITVADVHKALDMREPHLRLLTFKRRGSVGERLVPIARSELDYIVEYIENYRALVIEKFLHGNDHGYLLVSHTTGRKLVPNTVTLELHSLRLAAGIRGKAHPHLFRHRYVTEMFRRLIRTYKVCDKAGFMELYYKMEHFKREVMELSGHLQIESLERYVDWAFALSPLVEADTESVDISAVAREGRATMAELEVMRDQMLPEDFSKYVLKQMRTLVDELSRADGLAREKAAGHAMLEKAVGDGET